VRARDPHKEKAVRAKALALLVKEGFDGFSMQKLAKAAKVSPATLYIYYKDKDDLIFRLHDDMVKLMVDTSLEGFDPDMPFAEGLKVQWRNRRRFWLEHPQEAQFLEQVRFSPLHDKAAKTMDPRFMESMKAFAGNAIRREELAKMPVEVFWSLAYAPLYQLLKFHIHGRGMPGNGPFTLDDKTLERALERVLKALRP
jgi:AcrR family transcriptional regulator